MLTEIRDIFVLIEVRVVSTLIDIQDIFLEIEMGVVST